MIQLFPALAPIALIVAAVIASRQPGLRPEFALGAANAAALVALTAAAGSAVLLAVYGNGTSWLLGAAGLGLSVRLDPVSVTMLLIVSFVGWIVTRYSATYLDGEPRQGLFTARMCAALAAVMLLVLAGNLVQLLLAWIATSFALHRLLLFYPSRRGAQRAARKKFVTARTSDTLLLAAVTLLFAAFGTGDIAAILEAARAASVPPLALVATGLIGFAALLKSAQFPAHGWLVEVMETPTPVSALLHAGIINAGGFLLIRFADLMLTAPGVLALLVIVGGFTALLASVVMLAQPTVKTSLAWSTIAQMGFMILQCGLALFPLALLHIVAHSLYKAHAFLSSGTGIERIAQYRRPGPVAVPSGGAVAQAFLGAIVMYFMFGVLFGLHEKPPQAMALGAILIFGVAYLLAQGLADAAPRRLTQQTALYSVAASLTYFSLQSIAERLTSGTLPPTPAAGPLEWTLIILAVLTFGLVALAQALFPLWAGHPAAQSIRVHIANGLYANAVLDRLLGSWSTARPLKPSSGEA
jgi:NAD(P)H-quinone oxidoreductase subunit 5